MAALLKSRLFLWLLLALPGVGMLYAYVFTPEDYTYGMIIGNTGEWAVWLLMATLAVTPLRLMFRGRRWTSWLMRRRRDLGVASFAYAAGHTIIYLLRKASPEIVLAEMATPYLLAGWIALALFVPLAVTSNDISVRRLRRSWKTLHRLVYPAAILVFVHWVLSAFDPTTAWIHVGILAAIEIVRIILQRR